MLKKDKKRFYKFINFLHGPLPPAYCIKIHPEIEGIPCQEWNGCCKQGGYGMFSYKGKTELAHRRMYKIKKGKIPKGFDVCHKCDNPPCVNEIHLWAGKENNQDTEAKGRSLHLRGSKHGKAKLTEKLVQRIRRKYKTGRYSLRKLGQDFGVSYSLIGYIVNRKICNHV